MSANIDFERIPTWYIEQAVNDTFPGTQMFVRDCNLSDAQLTEYEIGRILRELGFVDSTHRVMGMATTHRIAIISNRMRDISDAIEDEEKKAWGLCLAQRDSRFKVLDVYEYEGKTQILLLHLPNDERWRLFDGVVMTVEEDLVATCRERFENKCNAEVIPELVTEEWLGRCAYPIGLDDDNKPFNVDISLANRLKPLGKMGFREIAGSVVYARNAKDAINGEWAKENPEYPDYVAYGYIDRECGLSLHVLGSARIVDGETEYLHDFEDRAFTFRLGGIESVECAQVVDSALSEFAERISSFREGYGMDDPQLCELRGIGILDQFRHPQYPDDVKALLFKEGVEGIEQVWLRTCAVDENKIFASLLNEPNADFGVHEGDILPIGFAEGEDGLVCVAIPEPQVLDSGREAIDASGPHSEPYLTVVREGAPVLTPEEYQSGHDGEIADCFAAIIKGEAPIEETWLCNRVRETFGIGRSGKHVQARSEAVLKKVPHKTTRWNGKRFIWRKGQDPDAYTAYRANPERDSDRIAFQEIANAVLDVLSTGFPKNEEMLIRDVANAFGYQRVASRIRETFAKAIKDMVKKGLIDRDGDGTFALPKPEGFVFASGVELTDGGRVTEGYYRGDLETVIASVSLEKLLQVICFYIAAQEEKPVGFFLELPCTADEEDELRENDEGPLHYGVYYSGALDCDSAIGLMHRYRDILLNSGLITFGFFCNETESQITVDKYKVVTIIGLDIEVVDRIFALSDVPQGKPVTAWDTISEKTPGKNYKVEVDGKTIDGFLPKMKKDFGLELDRYEAEESDAVRLNPCKPSPVEGSKPFMVPVYDGAIAIPDAYRRLPRQPEDPEWLTGFALHTDNADIFGAVHPLDDSFERLPGGTAETVADAYRGKLEEGQAIVEAGSGETPAGRKYSYVIWKGQREPSGVQYDLLFQMQVDGGEACVRGFFNEVGTTGVRDAMVFELRARELGGMQQAIEGWMRDPYDPSLTEGFLMNGSEDKQYDAMFPAHPLSEARRLVSFIVEHDVRPEDFGAKPKPCIPTAHEEYGLLPYRREHGGEVFSYPAELDYIDKRIAEIEGDEETGERKVNVHPFKADSYDEYYGMLAELAEKYRPVDSELAEEIELIIDIIKSMNVKEEWSIVRYVGDQFEGDPLADAHDLTKGRCYYWPCSKAHPIYEGVIDNEETTSYLYPCDPDSWEIVVDPTGMAERALAGEADTVESWRTDFLSDPESFESRMAEVGLTPKHKAAPSIQDFEEQEDLSDSEQDPVDFNCPDCGKPIHFEAWTLLNAQKDPKAAQRLIEGKLSEFTCPNCGYTSSLAHPCLYLDPEHNVFVYSVLDERMAGMAEEMFAEQPEGRHCRIVNSRLQLQDKAAIFMAGLDDRPMEILKTGITGQAKSQGLVAEGEECEAYFTGIGDDGELLFDIEIGDTTFTSSIDKGGYDLFASDLAKSSMADDDPLYVNREWVHRAIDAIAAKESDPSQRHQIRYFFEHKLLPQLFFEDKGEFVNAVLGDKDLLFRAMDSIFQKEGLANPYSPDQFKASAETIAGDINVLKIKYPNPEEEPLCYCSFLFFDAKFKKLGFYCLERGGDLSGDGIPFICSWSEEGAHSNHGNCLLDEHEALLKCADIYMERETASKAKPKKGTQMCSTPGCGNPAAYKTRGKPAYCTDCIERIAAEAGLVLEEPMVKPNDFIMTTCKRCGGRAHYRFNYILDKHDIGERVCRRCYWESWYQGSRDQFGVSQGHGNLMTEKGAKWLADQFGYDLLDLVPGAIPGEELYHVKCQACGRVTYERFGDMAWRCSCSRKQKGAPKGTDKLLRQALDM